MEETKINNKVIQKNDSSFPEHFDFEWLRNKGLEHIGQLSGKIWTDHNTHDPGITMMELLCYALIDLGYRTKLPIEDLLAKKNDEIEDNFFTPAEILTCNPTTIMDYRKMLMDIDGVQNAWLEIEQDEYLVVDCNVLEGDHLSCKTINFNPEPDTEIDPDNSNILEEDEFKLCLNGLYRVYIELENDDPYCLNGESQSEELQEQKDAILAEVKKRLSRYRNLCEDFTTIHTLCTEEIGLCAEIELTEAANPEEIYVEIMEKVNNFLTPQINYYTLEDFLNKGKTIEEAFEGRPYLTDFSKTDECDNTIIESRGFIDDEELKNIKRHTSIHLSDIYKLILEINGVASVKNLVLNGWIDDIQEPVESSNYNPTLGHEADEERCWTWELPLHEGYVPQLCFEYTCLKLIKGGFTYTISQDEIEQRLRSSILAGTAPLLNEENLNMPIPTGNYRPDLGEYYSIQNDLPNVYGVGEGGIPNSATDLRKAQALQLKGYLMFYDQMLATYISQIGNLRHLFSLKPDSQRSADDLHTYFPQLLDSVPQAEQLIQFYADTNSGLLDGTVLGLPVQTEPTNLQLEELKRQKDFECQREKYYFDKAIDRNIAISQLQREFRQGDINTTICEDESGFFFVIKTRFSAYLLMSRKHYCTYNEAKSAAESIAYLGTLPQAYQKAKKTIENIDNTYEEKYTFSIVYKNLDYLTIVQKMVEDESQYCERREEFLEHLLARFAENFNEYALLNYTLELDAKQRIERKGQLLCNYPTISRNRGKAYDYCQPSWDTDNRSGLENKIAALAGLSPIKQAICNFEVDCVENGGKIVQIKNPRGHVIMESDCTFESDEKVQQFLETFFSKCARDKANYKDINTEGKYSFFIECENCKVYYIRTFETTKQRDAVKQNICRSYTYEPEDEDIFVSKSKNGKPVEWKYYFLRRNEGEASIPVFQSIKSFNTKKKAINAYQKDAKKMPKADLKTEEDGTGKVYLSGRKTPSMESYQGKGADSDADAPKREFEFYKKIQYPGRKDAQTVEKDFTICPAKFRVIKKDPIAIYPCACFDENDESSQKEIDRLCANIAKEQYKILKICLAGDICTMIDGKYHYVIRDKNDGTIYLISYEGYPTIEEATAAFNENYLQLIDLASDVENYNIDSNTWTVGMQGKVTPLACIPEDFDLDVQQLANCFCTYPIRIKKEEGKPCCDNDTASVSYYFHLVNPHFQPTDNDDEDCKADWRSTQCYETPEEAIKDFNLFQTLLKNKENIRPIPEKKFNRCFEKEEDCNCKNYISVIEVLVESCETYRSEELAWRALNDFIQCANNIENYILNDSNDCYTFQIWDNGGGQTNLLEEACQEYQFGQSASPEEGDLKLAESPTCYECISDMLDAIRRLLACINQEGMHLVEHILLRPVRDDGQIENCCLIQPTDVDCCCKLEYELETEEACAENTQETSPYIPGADTYSFWATVVLPGWTSSFSTHNQRDLFQELLYKNTPAHIGLNIVWISPQQMCEFEGKYSQWLQRFTCNSSSDNDNIQCEMVDCLAQLSDYTPMPKEDPENTEEGCLCKGEEQMELGLNKNKLFVNHQFYNQKDTLKQEDMSTILRSSGNSNFAYLPVELAMSATALKKASVNTILTNFKKSKQPKAPRTEALKEKPVAKTTAPPRVLLERRKKYIANLANIEDKVMREDRVMYRDAMAYLKSGKTDFEAYEYVADRIFQYGQKPGGVETDLFFYLLCNATWCYLDIASWLDKRNIQHPEKWQEIVNKMKAQNVNRPKLLKGWNGGDIKISLQSKSVGRYYRMIRQ